MRATIVQCKRCRCFHEAYAHRTGALTKPNTGLCTRHPPVAHGDAWAQYPVVSGTWGCFDGIAKKKEEIVADKLMEI